MSFKLETDPQILLSKAEGAIRKYGVHAVVANLLTTRADENHIVSLEPSTSSISKSTASSSSGEAVEASSLSNEGKNDVKVVTIQRPRHLTFIEPLLASSLASMHNDFARSNQTGCKFFTCIRHPFVFLIKPFVHI